MQTQSYISAINKILKIRENAEFFKKKLLQYTKIYDRMYKLANGIGVAMPITQSCMR